MSTADIPTKLDQVLKAIEKLNKKMDSFYSELESYNERVTNLEEKLNERCAAIETNLSAKTEPSDVENALSLKANVADLQKIYNRLETLEAQERDRQANALMKESYYEKRMNILIQGLDENFNLAWETRDATKAIIYKFMKEGLNFQVPSDIVMSDFHRLPQKPLCNNERQRISRPVIIKLTSAADKRVIFSLAKKLKVHK